MRLRLLALALSMFLPLTVHAGGYGKATWGMTMAGVQKLYPGGLLPRPRATRPGTWSRTSSSGSRRPATSDSGRTGSVTFS
jgi:hypothetical protein